jgi:hypothetical protein
VTAPLPQRKGVARLISPEAMLQVGRLAESDRRAILRALEGKKAPGAPPLSEQLTGDTERGILSLAGRGRGARRGGPGKLAAKWIQLPLPATDATNLH